MAARAFTLEAVKEFIVNSGSRVTNHDLVTKFKNYLNDPQDKVLNREKFKDFVNTLATIKVDEKGEKILVLKKKYRDRVSNKSSNSDITAESIRAQSEPPRNGTCSFFDSTDSLDGGMSSRVHSEGNLSGREGASVSGNSSLNDSLGSGLSSSSFSSTGAADNDVDLSVMSVKERAQHLNKIDSESQLQNASSGQRKRETRSAYRDKDGDEDFHSSGSGYVELDPVEKEWLVTCASADYHSMHQLLNKKPALAKLRDFTSTALHWAAKHGKSEVVKMIAAKSGVNVNQRTGYTPLHLAAVQGHEDIIELLVHTYKADPNIRDYSGKKAKQYLKFSASSRAQQLLVSSRLSSKSGKYDSDDSFTRSASFRKSNRMRAVSSLIQGPGTELLVSSRLSSKSGKYDSDDSFTRSASFRKSNRMRAVSSLIQGPGTGMIQFPTSWDDSSIKNMTPKSTPTTSPANSAGPSPVQQRKGSMPPPSAPVRKSSKPHHSISKESLISEEKKFSERGQVTRSESEPNLGGALETGSSKQTYV